MEQYIIIGILLLTMLVGCDLQPEKEKCCFFRERFVYSIEEAEKMMNKTGNACYEEHRWICPDKQIAFDNDINEYEIKVNNNVHVCNICYETAEYDGEKYVFIRNCIGANMTYQERYSCNEEICY